MEWDKGLDYDELKCLIRDKLEEVESCSGKREEKLLTYWSILAVQLSNGLRISEAIDAVREFARSGKRELTVKVRKKRTKEEKRPVRIPKLIKDWYRDVIREYVFDDKIERRIVAWASKHGINTHSVRYAWITKKLRDGHNPAIVAKAVRHSRIDIILLYTQKIKADRLIEED